MPKFKIVYFVDGEERTGEVEGWRGIDEFLALLEVGTRYQVYAWRDNTWVFSSQSTVQPPKQPWGHTPWPD